MEYNIDEIVSELDFNSLQFANLKNGLLLTNNEIRVLDKYNIDYNDNFFEQTKIIYYLFDKMEIMSLAHEMSEISGFPIQKCFLNTRAQRI